MQTHSETSADTASSGFLEALAAPGPSPDRSTAPDLYGWLVGSWDAEAIDHLADGSERRQSAEMHFAWVLEGRVLQDLWIVPSRRDRQGLPAPGNRYGTTFRMWDPTLGAWRIRWINPVNGIESTLVARRIGDAIVQTGSDTAGRLQRWIFEDIRPDSFHWRGDISQDGGATWKCETEFLATRRR